MGTRTLTSANKIPLQEHIVLTVDMEKLLLYNVSYDALLKELENRFQGKQHWDATVFPTIYPHCNYR